MNRAIFVALALALVAGACSRDRTRTVYVEANCYDRGDEDDGYVAPPDLDIWPDDMGDAEPDGPQLAPWRPGADSAVERPHGDNNRLPGFGV